MLSTLQFHLQVWEFGQNYSVTFEYCVESTFSQYDLQLQTILKLKVKILTMRSPDFKILKLNSLTCMFIIMFRWIKNNKEESKKMKIMMLKNTTQ